MKIQIIAILIFLFGCKTAEKISNEETNANIKEKIESQKYIFKPTTAIPMGGKSINLDYSYSLKVSKDTIESYLPYFGRAYVAPSPTDEGGIKFTSTEFEYSISEKKKDMWHVNISTSDQSPKYTLRLDIGSSGYATLSAQDNNRQMITFYGKIE